MRKEKERDWPSYGCLRGRVKLQDSVTKVNTEHLVTSRSPAKHKGKCKRLRG